VIIVSAYAMLLIGEKNLGASDFLQKPFDLNNLLSGVNEVVRDVHPRFRFLPPTS
jgi:FixJ family two-component response regulator